MSTRSPDHESGNPWGVELGSGSDERPDDSSLEPIKASRIPLSEFDLNVRASNGLRRGLTTGTCATAATQAALRVWLGEAAPHTVLVNLPDRPHYVRVQIEIVRQIEGGVEACVIKDAGDDPDVTNGCRVRVCLYPEEQGIRFKAGPGVGIITKSGFALPVGEPAINPVPRQMILQTIAETLNTSPAQQNQGFRVVIGIDDGERLAEKTYNPRLGIVGGLSILGTSGIVEPKSLASWLASIELYVRIALADEADQIVLAPGNIGQWVAEQQLGLAPQRVVPMANFVGFALNAVQEELATQGRHLSRLWLVGHPGKLGKILEDQWDTHSSVSPMAMQAIIRLASDFGVDSQALRKCQNVTTVEGIIQILRFTSQIEAFWLRVEREIAYRVEQRINKVQQVSVLLFDMHKYPLAGSLNEEGNA